MKRKKVHNANDVSITYLQETSEKELFNFFKLPGKFVKSFPKTIIRRDGSKAEMDWLILVDPDNENIFERTLINVEFQTKRVSEKKIKIISDYKDHSKTYYGLPVLTVIVVFDEKEYKASVKEYATTVSDILRPMYIYVSWEELKERLNNLENKIGNKEKLSNEEAFDIAFLPMFAPKQKAKFVTEKVTKLYKKDNTIEIKIRYNIAYVLGIMIRKYFDFTPKGKELLKLMEKDIDRNALRDVIDYEMEWREKAHQIEIEEKNNEIQEKNAELLERNNELQEKNAELLERNNELQEKDAELLERNNELQEKNAELLKQNKENTKLKKILQKNGISY